MQLMVEGNERDLISAKLRSGPSGSAGLAEFDIDSGDSVRVGRTKNEEKN